MSRTYSLRLAALVTAVAVAVILPAAGAANPANTTTPTPSSTAAPSTAPSDMSIAAGGVDLAAIGTTIRAVAVNRVTLRVGVKNIGSAALVLPAETETWHPVVAYVYLPRNTFGYSVDYKCAGWGPSPDGWEWLDPGRPSTAYACRRTRLDPGQTEWIDLTVTVHGPAPRSPGYILVGQPDANPANDKANIIVLTTPPPRHPNGGSPELPVTGASLLPITTLGTGLILLGALALWLSRRRRAVR